MLREGYKQNGFDHGTVILRNANGKMLAKYEFEHGAGTHFICNSSGAIGSEIPYRVELLHGVKRHYIKASIDSEENYKDGKKI